LDETEDQVRDNNRQKLLVLVQRHTKLESVSNMKRLRGTGGARPVTSICVPSGW